MGSRQSWYMFTKLITSLRVITALLMRSSLYYYTFLSLLLQVHNCYYYTFIIATTIRSYRYQYISVSLLQYVHFATTTNTHCCYYALILLRLYVHMVSLFYRHNATDIINTISLIPFDQQCSNQTAYCLLIFPFADLADRPPKMHSLYSALQHY